MDLLDGFRVVAGATDGPVDREAVRRAARATTDPGTVPGEEGRVAYRRDFEAVRGRVTDATTLDVAVPSGLVLLDRHEWIDAALADERRLWEEADAGERGPLGEGTGRLAALVTAGPEAAVWSTLAAHAVGRYDPLNWVSVAAGADGHLAVVPPNVERVAGRLDAVWGSPRTLPTLRELGVFTADEGDAAADGARRWLARVDP